MATGALCIPFPIGSDFKVCVAVRIGTSRSNDVDGNENVKKTIDFISKTTTLQQLKKRNSISLSVLVYGA